MYTNYEIHEIFWESGEKVVKSKEESLWTYTNDLYQCAELYWQQESQSYYRAGKNVAEMDKHSFLRIDKKDKIDKSRQNVDSSDTWNRRYKKDRQDWLVVINDNNINEIDRIVNIDRKLGTDKIDTEG